MYFLNLLQDYFVIALMEITENFSTCVHLLLSVRSFLSFMYCVRRKIDYNIIQSLCYVSKQYKNY